MKSKVILPIFAALLMLSIITYAAQSHVISNTYENSVVALPNDPLTVGPDAPSGGMPKMTSVGVPFDLGVDVGNPNPASVFGMFLLNITAPGIVSSDVHVYSAPCYDTSIVCLAQSGDTLMFEAQMTGQIASPYFELRTGNDANVTVISICFLTANSYTYDLAITQ